MPTNQPAPLTKGLQIQKYKKGKNMEKPRRNGKPRTTAERKKRHKKLYGNTNLPPRGTGRKKEK